MNEQRLNEFSPGATVTVEKILTAEPALRMRLLEMGLVKGSVVEIIRYAPLGDPIEVKVRGYRLSIRKIEAESVVVSKQQ